MKRVHQLTENGIKPIIVFDGNDLPMKSNTEHQRNESRNSNKRKGLEYLNNGHKSKAIECFQSAVEITSEMAYEWIKELRKYNIDYIVAPYEADAQLAYLSRNNICDLVISEDSDLLCFGCTRVLFKLGLDGNGIEIKLHDIGQVQGLKNWTFDKFRQMCILAGCDYLRLDGVGGNFILNE
jgi:exonuclease-1